jgi:hypothetical protein
MSKSIDLLETIQGLSLDRSNYLIYILSIFSNPLFNATNNHISQILEKLCASFLIKLPVFWMKNLAWRTREEAIWSSDNSGTLRKSDGKLAAAVRKYRGQFGVKYGLLRCTVICHDTDRQQDRCVIFVMLYTVALSTNVPSWTLEQMIQVRLHKWFNNLQSP